MARDKTPLFLASDESYTSDLHVAGRDVTSSENLPLPPPMVPVPAVLQSPLTASAACGGSGLVNADTGDFISQLFSPYRNATEHEGHQALTICATPDRPLARKCILDDVSNDGATGTSRASVLQRVDSDIHSFRQPHLLLETNASTPPITASRHQLAWEHFVHPESSGGSFGRSETPVSPSPKVLSAPATPVTLHMESKPACKAVQEEYTPAIETMHAAGGAQPSATKDSQPCAVDLLEGQHLQRRRVRMAGSVQQRLERTVFVDAPRSGGPAEIEGSDKRTSQQRRASIVLSDGLCCPTVRSNVDNPNVVLAGIITYCKNGHPVISRAMVGLNVVESVPDECPACLGESVPLPSLQQLLTNLSEKRFKRGTERLLFFRYSYGKSPAGATVSKWATFFADSADYEFHIIPNGRRVSLVQRRLGHA